MSNEINQEKYWEDRKELNYYNEVHELVRLLAPFNILDVGTGPTKYIDELLKIGFSCTIIDIKEWDVYKNHEKLGTRLDLVIGDFLDPAVRFEAIKKKGNKFQLVSSLQTIEHIPDERRKDFINYLFEMSQDYVLISLPYKWTQPDDHANIDETVIKEWFGRDPVFSKIVDRRIINLYLK